MHFQKVRKNNQSHFFGKMHTCSIPLGFHGRSEKCAKRLGSLWTYFLLLRNMTKHMNWKWNRILQMKLASKFAANGSNWNCFNTCMSVAKLITNQNTNTGWQCCKVVWKEHPFDCKNIKLNPPAFLVFLPLFMLHSKANKTVNHTSIQLTIPG